MSGIHHYIADRIAKGELPVRVWREQSALTIDQLAKRCGVSSERLLEIDTGSALGTDRELECIASVFGIQACDLQCPAIIDDEIPW